MKIQNSGTFYTVNLSGAIYLRLAYNSWFWISNVVNIIGLNYQDTCYLEEKFQKALGKKTEDKFL